MSLPDLKNFDRARLAAFVSELDLPAFRTAQIFSWLYRPGTVSFQQMTDISKQLRAELEQRATITTLTPSVIERSKDGTIKFAFELADSHLIESVLIPEGERNTLCVSSQVGCAMGCGFCLTGGLGLRRNLLPSEIVGQVQAIRDQLLAEDKGGINNLVFMGMGEPLANLDNLLVALDILLDQGGLDFSDRRITVSTCGLVPQMLRFGAASRVNLAVSLHSVRNDIRDKLMPVNRTYPVEALLQACREYPLAPRKRIMFEYILLKDINDSDTDARELAMKLRGIRCKINLLPYNETDGLPYRRPDRGRIENFQQILWQHNYTVLVRESRGGDISAACGQLAGKRLRADAPV